MAAIERQDLISDDALKAPQVLTENLTALLQSIDAITAASKEFGDGLKNAPLPKLKTDTEGLTQANVELIKTQNQIASVVAKNNETNIAYMETLRKAKEELKLSKAMADDWTKSANQQNSSIVSLTDALNKNRVAYANLRSETDRQSKSGQDLLKTIQTQDKSLKDLTASMGQNQSRVGGYREELEKLIPALRSVNPAMGEAAESATQLGSKLGILGPVALVIVAAVAYAGAALKAFFNSTHEGAIEFEENSIKMGVVWDLMVQDMAKKGKWLYDHTIKPIINSIAEMSDAGFDAIQLAKELTRIAEEETANIERKAKVQLEADRLIFESRDKLTKSDQERLAAVDKADAMLKTQSEINVKLLKERYNAEYLLTRLTLDGAKPIEDVLKKEAEMRAQIAQAEDAYFQGSRRRQAERIQISRDIITKQIELEKLHTEAVLKSAELILQTNITTNQKILESSEATLEEKIAATKEITEDQIRLIQLVASKEIEAARIVKKEKQLAAGGDKAAVLALERAFVDTETAILAKAQQDQLKVIKDGHKQVEMVVINDAAKMLEIRQRISSEEEDQELHNMTEAFRAGDITLAQFLAARREMVRRFAHENGKIQIEEYNQELIDLDANTSAEVKLTQKYADDVNAIRDKIRKTRHALDVADGKDEEDNRKAVNAKLVQLANAMLTSAIQTGNNLYDAKIQQANDEIALLQNQSTKEQALAGDNAEAKLRIENLYNQKIEEANKKVKRLQHDKAVYDRDLAIAKIAMDTAIAIMEIWSAYAEFPYVAAALTAVMAGIGTAETIAVATTPIPSYEVGTTNHPGGPAVVAEGGTELVMEPGRAPKLYDVPNTYIPNLAAGAQVFTAEDTRAIEQQLLGRSMQSNYGNPGPIIINDNADVVEAVNGIRLPSVVAQGRELMEVWSERDGTKKWIRSKLFINP